MRTHDRGHWYALQVYDRNRSSIPSETWLRFMKRVGEGYPGNDGPPYSGTNCQEILRVLIDRVKYLDGQIPCSENAEILGHLRQALLLFEQRAARRHGRELSVSADQVEDEPACPQCGHVRCEGHRE